MRSRNLAGITWINGREYLLNGRYIEKSQAVEAQVAALKMWDDVKIRNKHGYWSVWVHGSKS